MAVHEMVAHEDSIRLALKLAWQDHQHVRNQAFKALFARIILALAVIAVACLFSFRVLPIAFSAIFLISALPMIMYFMHHRTIERRKFQQIYNCEEVLGLHRSELFPKAECAAPQSFSLFDVFNFRCNNSVVFLIRFELVLDALVLSAGIRHFYVLLN